MMNENTTTSATPGTGYTHSSTVVQQVKKEEEGKKQGGKWMRVHFLFV